MVCYYVITEGKTKTNPKEEKAMTAFILVILVGAVSGLLISQRETLEQDA